MRTITVQIMDNATGQTKAVTIAVTSNNILIHPHGYGDYYSPDNEGFPILFEFVDDKPQVVVWGDINAEDPTDVIDLEGANEDRRD